MEESKHEEPDLTFFNTGKTSSFSTPHKGSITQGNITQPGLELSHSTTSSSVDTAKIDNPKLPNSSLENSKRVSTSTPSFETDPYNNTTPSFLSRSILPPRFHQTEHHRLPEMTPQYNYPNNTFPQYQPSSTQRLQHPSQHPSQHLLNRPHTIQHIYRSPVTQLPQLSQAFSTAGSPQASILSNSNTPPVVQYQAYPAQHQQIPQQMNPYEKQNQFHSFPGYPQGQQQQQQQQEQSHQLPQQLPQQQPQQPITYSQFPVPRQLDTPTNLHYQQIQPVQTMPPMQNISPIYPQQHLHQQPPPLMIQRPQQQHQFLPSPQVNSPQNSNEQSYGFYTQQLTPRQLVSQNPDSETSSKTTSPVVSQKKSKERAHQEEPFLGIKESSRKGKHSLLDNLKPEKERGKCSSDSRIEKPGGNLNVNNKKPKPVKLGIYSNLVSQSKLDPITSEAAENYLAHHSDSIRLSKDLLWAATVSKDITKFHQYIHENAAIQHFLEQERSTQSETFEFDQNNYKIEEFYKYIQDFPKKELVNLNLIFSRLSTMLSDWMDLKEKNVEAFDFQYFVEKIAHQDTKGSLIRHARTSNVPGESVSLQVIPVKPNTKPNSNVMFNSQGTLQPDLSIKVKMVCQHCGSTSTPEWRKGPEDARTLCNACGLFHTKLVKKMGSEAAAKELKRRRDEGEQTNRRI